MVWVSGLTRLDAVWLKKFHDLSKTRQKKNAGKHSHSGGHGWSGPYFEAVRLFVFEVDERSRNMRHYYSDISHLA